MKKYHRLAMIMAGGGLTALLLGGNAPLLGAAETVTVDGKQYPLKKVDDISDFADPRKYELPLKNVNGEMMKVTPEGVPFAWDKPRGKALKNEYFAIKFPVEKVFAGAAAASKGGACLSCHQGIEKISDTHDFACVQCHKGNDQATAREAAHQDMHPNPSDGAVAAQTCGSCHADQLHKVETSLMATAAGEINATRYAWGAQDDVSPRYSANGKGGTKMLPTQQESGQMVDDMLRKKCVRCHINSPAPNRAGEYRATGCAACHMIYANDGKSISGDKAIQQTQAANLKEKGDHSGMIGKRGYPMKHRLTTAIPTVQCVRCHSGNRVGTEYVGLFEHDYNNMYRSPRVEFKVPPGLYGIDHHTLTPDAHYKAGLACIDCHLGSEIMGNGKVLGAAHEATEVSCADCHGTPATAAKTGKVAANDPALKAAAANPNYTLKVGDEVAVTAKGSRMGNVKKTAKGLVLTSKVTGREHLIPQVKDMKNQPVAHQVAKHVQNMDCSACHSKWGSFDFGTHLIREDYAAYKKWQKWSEPDPQIMKALAAGDDAPPLTKDWLSGQDSTGIWYGSLSMRTWENVILGKNPAGKYAMFRPQYQFFVSHIGPEFGKLRAEAAKIQKQLFGLTDPDQRNKVRLELQKLEKQIQAQIFMDNQLLMTKKGTPGLVMNSYSPHTTQQKGRSCEACHTNAEAAGLGRSLFYQAKKEWIPQLDASRAKLPIDFQIHQVVSIDGKALQTTTQQGARFLNKQEIDAMLGKSPAYRAARFEDLRQRNYETLLSRNEAKLTGGAERMVKEGISNGDVRKVGSYYDTKRYGFWQTDPIVFTDEYFKKGLKTKTGREVWSDPAVQEEKKAIEAGSRTYLKPETTNFNWVPKKQQ